MSDAVQELLAAFDSLPAGEKDAAIEALMMRHSGAGDLPEAGAQEGTAALWQHHASIVAFLANISMRGSVLFHSPDAHQISAAVRCWPKKPLAEVVVEFMHESTVGNDADDRCVDFVRWFSRQSPAPEVANFGIVNLPGLPWAGAKFDRWEWYDCVMAEVATWEPPPVLVDVEYLAVTHRGEVLWPTPELRSERPADRRTRPPGEPFAMGWYGQSFKGHRAGESTYGCYPPEELPPISVPLTGTFDWLHAAPEHDGTVYTSADPAVAEALAMLPPEMRGARPIGASPDRIAAALGRLLASTPVALPAAFVTFFETPTLWRRFLSCTDCYLNLDEAAVEIRIGLGWLVRFLSDSQYCRHWCLFVAPCSTKHAVVSTGFFSGSDAERPEDAVPHPRDITTCAASFEEFVYRFWLENELCYTSNRPEAMPVGGAEYLAFYRDRALPT